MVVSFFTVFTTPRLMSAIALAIVRALCQESKNLTAKSHGRIQIYPEFLGDGGSKSSLFMTQ